MYPVKGGGGMEDMERLVAVYGPSIYRLAYARTGQRADAEDGMQEVFVKLLRAKPAFRDEEHRKAWLLRVTANCAADFHRAARRRQAEPLSEQVPAPEEPEGDVLAAVCALPPKYRSAVHLFYYEELSVAEIAGILGLSRGAVKTRLSRARAMLRERLEGGGAHE